MSGFSWWLLGRGLGRALPDLTRGLIGLLHDRPRRLGGAAEVEQPLVEDRWRRVGVAARPAGPHEEVLQRPVDRSAEPRDGRDLGELRADEPALELVGATLVDRPLAVRLGVQLADQDPLLGVAGGPLG